MLTSLIWKLLKNDAAIEIQKKVEGKKAITKKTWTAVLCVVVAVWIEKSNLARIEMTTTLGTITHYLH